MQLLPVVTKEPVALMEYVNVLKGNKELIVLKTNLPHHQTVNIYLIKGFYYFLAHTKFSILAKVFEFKPFFLQKIGLILLTTGRLNEPNGADSAASQVVNILDSSSTCQNIPDYPVAVHLAGGGIVDNVPIVCGGYSDDHGRQADCYKLDRDTIQWTLLTDALPVNYREVCKS